MRFQHGSNAAPLPVAASVAMHCMQFKTMLQITHLATHCHANQTTCHARHHSMPLHVQASCTQGCLEACSPHYLQNPKQCRLRQSAFIQSHGSARRQQHCRILQCRSCANRLFLLLLLQCAFVPYCMLLAAWRSAQQHCSSLLMLMRMLIAYCWLPEPSGSLSSNKLQASPAALKPLMCAAHRLWGQGLTVCSVLLCLALPALPDTPPHSGCHGHGNGHSAQGDKGHTPGRQAGLLGSWGIDGGGLGDGAAAAAAAVHNKTAAAGGTQM